MFSDIFIVGGSGFLGRNLLSKLNEDNFNFVAPSRFELFSLLSRHERINLFIHSVGKAHSTKKTKDEAQAYFEVNFELTKKITETIDEYQIELDTFVFISTVAVYGLDEGFDVREDTPLIGNSPYAQSKKMAEEHLQLWAKEVGVNLVILRLPLIFGENAPGNLGAMERAVKGRYYFQIANGQAKRSMVHVKQLAQFLPTLIGKSGIYNLTDGIHSSYRDVAQHLAEKYNRKIINIPLLPLKIIALFGGIIPNFPLTSYRLSKLSHSLTFSDQKARRELGWNGTNALKV